MRSPTVLASVVAVLAVLASCGGDDAAPASTTGEATSTSTSTADSSTTTSTTSTTTTSTTTTTTTTTTTLPPPTTAAPVIVASGCELLTAEEVQAVTADPVVEARPGERAGWQNCNFVTAETSPTLSRIGTKQVDPATFEAVRDEWVRELVGGEIASIEPYPIGDAAFLVTAINEAGPLLSMVFVVDTNAVGINLGVIGGDPATVRSALEQLAAIAAGRL